jgi:hypothetical protein
MAAAMDLTPKSAAKAFEGDGGGYYIWSFPALGEANVAAGKLVLKPSGFALPHYADSAKLGYVLQGMYILFLLLLANKLLVIINTYIYI